MIEDKGVKVLIDPKAILFLLGTEMDFQTSALKSGFIFNNPNQTSACGCGESVQMNQPPKRPPALSTSAGFLEFLTEQMAGFGPVTVRRMFGGAGVFRDGVMFALIVDEVLYLQGRSTRTRRRFQGRRPKSRSLTRRRKARRTVMSYWRAPERCLDDPDEMTEWCRKAYACAEAAAKKNPRNSPQP